MDGPATEGWRPRATTHGCTADAWYTTGASHVICEDYAVATTVTPDCTVAVVCDGCSSSADTDIGARLVARAAVAHMARALPGTGVHAAGFVDAAAVLRRAAAAARPLGLPTEALDTTLLAMRVVPNAVDIAVFGDGVVAARRRDGRVEIWVVEHPKGAPPYPSYALEPQRHARYLARFGADFTVRHRGPDNVWTTQTRTTPPRWTLDPSAFDLVLLGSDGLTAFVGDAPADETSMEVLAPVRVDAVVGALMAVPHLQGRFVARRGRRFMKTAARRGWRGLDDIGLAAIAIGGEA